MQYVTAILALAFAPAIVCLPAPSHVDTTAIEQRHIDSANTLGYGNVAPIIWGERLAPYHAIDDVRLALLEQRKQKK